MNFKPLLCILNPRQIATFMESVKQLKKIDKFWIKNFERYPAYNMPQWEFLKPENKEYTHLILIIDDLIVTPEALDMLMADTLALPASARDKSVICGYCNLDMTPEGLINSNVCLSPVSEKREGRVYNWVTLSFLRKWRQRVDSGQIENSVGREEMGNRYLLESPFNGLTCPIIPRSIVEAVPFRDDTKSGRDPVNGCCYDVMFCHDARQQGFKIFTDVRIELKHLKHSAEAMRAWQTRGHDSSTWLEKATEPLDLVSVE